MISTASPISHHTKKLLERHNLIGLSSKEQSTELINKIERLSPWKFSTGVHTNYVAAIREISPEMENKAKQACNDTAFKPPYQL